MNIIRRLALAYKALVSPSKIADGTVRAWELGDTFGRRYQREAFSFVQRYSGYVKVAASRNASAVASTDMKVYRRVKGKASSFAARRLTHKQVERIDAFGDTRAKSVVRTSSDIEEIIDPLHPLVSIFRTANSQMTGYELLEYTELLQALAGSFYWITTNGTDGYPTEIWPGFPQYMRPVASKETYVDHYIYGRGVECEFKIDREQVITFKRPNPTGNPYYGLADLAAVTIEADLSTAFARFALSMLDRGAQPGLIMMGPATDEQRKGIEAELRRKAEGQENAGRSLVLALPAATADKWKIERWESAQKEAGYLAGQSEDTVLRRIASAFDIPVGLITLEEQSVANGRVAAPHWQLMSIMPRCRRIQERLNEEFVPKFYEALRDDSLFVAFDNPVVEDTEAASRIANANYTGGLITLNEARAEISKPPVDEGDDFKPEPSFGAPVNPDSEDQTDTTPALTEEKVVTITKLVSSDLPPCECEHECTDYGTKSVGGYPTKTDIGRIVDGVRAWINSVLPSIVVASDGSFTVNLSTPASKQAFEAAVGDVLDGIFSTTYNAQVREVNRRGANLEPLGIDNPRTADYFNTQRSTTFSGVSQTATDSIMQSLREGVANGETPGELQKRVKEAAQGISEYQAEMIARTEAANAHEFAKDAAWKDSAIVEKKEWLLANGSCPVCNAIKKHASAVPVGQPFVTAGTVLAVGGKPFIVKRDVQYPPQSHPNCRCATGAVFKDFKR